MILEMLSNMVDMSTDLESKIDILFIILHGGVPGDKPPLLPW